jgi:hypothetical protein
MIIHQYVSKAVQDDAQLAGERNRLLLEARRARMHGVYGHVSPGMRADLKAALQERWDSSLRERAGFSPRSIVPALDTLLAAYRQGPAMIRSQLAPKIGHRGSARRRIR